FEAVGGVAGGHDLALQEGELVGAEDLVAVAVGVDGGDPGEELPGQCDEVVAGGAGDDAVEVVGVALGLHQRLPSAVGASGEVGVPWGLPVVGLGDGLGGQRGDVFGAVSGVDAQLRVGVGPD